MQNDVEGSGALGIIDGVVLALSRRLAEVERNLMPDFTAKELRDLVACCKALREMAVEEGETGNVHVTLSEELLELAE